MTRNFSANVIDSVTESSSRVNVFLYRHTDDIVYVLENITYRKPHKVIGKFLEELGHNYQGDNPDVVRLHISKVGQFVRVEPVSQELELKILDSLK